MKNELILPDTSAIFTMMENEDGAEAVEEILRTRQILLPAIVLLEVYYKSIQLRGREIAELRYGTLKSIRATWLSDLGEPVLLQGGQFKAAYRISFADAIIGAYAYLHKATLLHKDPEYDALTMIDQIRLPYKLSS